MTTMVAAATIFGLSAPATAGAEAEPRSLSLIETGPAEPPKGFVELCERRPELCPTRRTASEVEKVEGALVDMFGAEALRVEAPELTSERYWALERVNAAVNARIRPVDDAGRDLWSFSPDAGDCEEYVLMKREMLARLGWPRALLRVAVVSAGEERRYHAVLLVSTRSGDFVLDNLEPEVMRIGEAPYEFLVAESVVHPGAWAHVRR